MVKVMHIKNVRNDSYLSHLVVSCHQVLNCLSIYSGYLLNVCAFFLLKIHIRAENEGLYNVQ